MRLRKIMSVLLLFAVLSGIAGALIPPPPPPPPVGQHIGLYDAGIDSILTTDGDHYYPSPTNQDASGFVILQQIVPGIREEQISMEDTVILLVA